MQTTLNHYMTIPSPNTPEGEMRVPTPGTVGSQIAYDCNPSTQKLWRQWRLPNGNNVQEHELDQYAASFTIKRVTFGVLVQFGCCTVAVNEVEKFSVLADLLRDPKKVMIDYLDRHASRIH